MIAVIDYKAGNLTSAMKAIRAVASDAVVTEDPDVLQHADRIILPGVGHFSVTRRLDDKGLTSAIRLAIARGTPFLGICVGMQWLLEGSEEAPEQPGLGYLSGQCKRFSTRKTALTSLEEWKVPHVGWNSVVACRESAPARLLHGIGDGSMMYFTHSYFVPTDCRCAAQNDETPSAAVCSYIQPFAATVEHENVMGVQFHPEMSGAVGLKVLENFVSWRC